MKHRPKVTAFTTCLLYGVKGGGLLGMGVMGGGPGGGCFVVGGSLPEGSREGEGPI